MHCETIRPQRHGLEAGSLVRHAFGLQEPQATLDEIRGVRENEAVPCANGGTERETFVGIRVGSRGRVIVGCRTDLSDPLLPRDQMAFNPRNPPRGFDDALAGDAARVTHGNVSREPRGGVESQRR